MFTTFGVLGFMLVVLVIFLCIGVGIFMISLFAYTYIKDEIDLYKKNKEKSKKEKLEDKQNEKELQEHMKDGIRFFDEVNSVEISIKDHNGHDYTNMIIDFTAEWVEEMNGWQVMSAEQIEKSARELMYDKDFAPVDSSLYINGAFVCCSCRNSDDGKVAEQDSGAMM